MDKKLPQFIINDKEASLQNDYELSDDYKAMMDEILDDPNPQFVSSKAIKARFLPTTK